jgi:hypothetical protein
MCAVLQLPAVRTTLSWRGVALLILLSDPKEQYYSSYYEEIVLPLKLSVTYLVKQVVMLSI